MMPEKIGYLNKQEAKASIEAYFKEYEKQRLRSIQNKARAAAKSVFVKPTKMKKKPVGVRFRSFMDSRIGFGYVPKKKRKR